MDGIVPFLPIDKISAVARFCARVDCQASVVRSLRGLNRVCEFAARLRPCPSQTIYVEEAGFSTPLEMTTEIEYRSGSRPNNGREPEAPAASR
jgi:hypothetical protein